MPHQYFFSHEFLYVFGFWSFELITLAIYLASQYKKKCVFISNSWLLWLCLISLVRAVLGDHNGNFALQNKISSRKKNNSEVWRQRWTDDRINKTYKNKLHWSEHFYLQVHLNSSYWASVWWHLVLSMNHPERILIRLIRWKGLCFGRC